MKTSCAQKKDIGLSLSIKKNVLTQFHMLEFHEELMEISSNPSVNIESALYN